MFASSKTDVGTRGRKKMDVIAGKYFERLYRSPVVQSDELQELILFPPNDVQIKVEPHFLRTTVSSVPKELLKAKKLPKHLRSTVNFFLQDWKVVTYSQKEAHGTGRISIPRSGDFPRLANQNLAVEQPTEKGYLDVDLLNWTVDKLKQESRDRNVDRRQIFEIISSSIQVEPSDTRVLPPPPKEKFKIQVMVECKELKFALGEKEPFFCSFVLFHRTKKKRVSEVFHFDMNNEKVLNMVTHKSEQRIDDVSKARRVIFSVPKRSEEVYLVLFVSKVLFGDSDETVLPYLKHATMKPKEIGGFFKKVEEACDRLGKWIQPFGWAAYPLFTEDGSLNESPEFPVFLQYRGSLSDKDIYDKLRDFIKEDGNKRAKRIRDVKVVVTARELEPDEEIEGRYTPSLLPVIPFSPDAPPVKEAHIFKEESEDLDLRLSYVNNLYVYPLSLNFGGIKTPARNIAVSAKLLLNDDDPSAKGLEVVYGESSGPMFVDEAWTPVTYRDKKPTFCNEFKFCLPATVPAKAHILFSFYNISCKPPKKSNKAKMKDPKVLIGYAALPLTKSGNIIINDEYSMNVAVELPAGYLSLMESNADPESGELLIQYVDKKPIFFVETHLESSIYSQDSKLDKFISHKERRENIELKLIGRLKSISAKNLAHYYPIIIDRLLEILIVGSTTLSMASFDALISVAGRISQLPTEGNETRHPLLETYVQYFFDNPQNPNVQVYDKLVDLWLTIVLNPQTDAEKLEAVNTYAWFLFDLIIKSITLDLAERNQLNSADRSRSIPAEFQQKLEVLFPKLNQKIQDYVTQDNFGLAQELNTSVGFFTKDLFTVADRGFVLEQIYKHVYNLNPENKDELISLSFTYLKIVTDYEHYIPLNLPLPDRITDLNQLCDKLWQKHFLVGLVINEVVCAQHSKNQENRIMAMEVLRMLLVKHDFDSRYSETVVKKRIGGLYFPFILRLISEEYAHVLEKKEKDEKMIILSCFLYILKNTSRHLLKQWWTKETPPHVHNFFNFLKEAVVIFEYDPLSRAKEQMAQVEKMIAMQSMENKKKPKGIAIPGGVSNFLPIAISGEKTKRLSSAPEENGGSRKNSGIAGGPMSIPVGPNAAALGTIVTNSVSKTKKAKAPVRPKRHHVPAISAAQENTLAHLGLEVSLLVLDTVMAFMLDSEKDLNSVNSVFHQHVFPVLFALLGACHADIFLPHMFKALSSVVNIFSKMLFVRTSVAHITNFGELTFGVLRHCDFENPQTRAMACSIAYLMMKKNFQERGNIARMKLQLTIGTERMVTEGYKPKEDTHLRRSLAAIAEMARMDENVTESFAEEVENLIDRLDAALENQYKIAQTKHDPEATCQLYLQTSESYTHSPDLRVIWLNNLAEFHKKLGNMEEAAQALIHIAALVCGYLSLLHSPDAVPLDYASFKKAAPNISRQLNLPPIDSDEGICTIKQFRRDSLFSGLFEAVEILKQNQLFETCIEIYQLLTTIHQKNRNYKGLVECYDDLQKISFKIAELNTNPGSRLFAKYYRVGFYGKDFGELNRNEYIYKESPTVRVADLTNRLKDQFGNKFGKERIKMLSNNAIVDASELDPKMLYIQVVETAEYREDDEICQTPWERFFNIRRFVFETPFVLPGHKMGDMKHQHKRKTILTTEAPFPSIVKRIKIIDKREETLTPIETSIELIKGRVTAMKQELSSPYPNTKTLQIVLQGSVLLQVNSGPLEICRIFLGEERDQYDPELIAKLEAEFREFVKDCGEAISLNNKLIDADQLAFHEKLVEGYEDAKVKIGAYLKGEMMTETKTTGEK